MLKILVPLDVSPASQTALQFLAHRPQICKHAEITLLTVHQLIKPSLLRLVSSADIDAMRDKTAQEVFETASKTFGALGQTPTCLAEVGDPRDIIVNKAREIGADLIIMAAHGERNIGDILMGSVSRGVIARAPCPVLVVRNQFPPLARAPRVVIPVDKQEVTSHAVDWVIANHKAFGAQADFRLVHVVEASSMDVLTQFTQPGSALEEDTHKGPRNAAWHEAVDPYARRFAEAGLTSRNVALTGRPSQAIADYVTSHDIDLIVMGSHARGELRALFLGSVAAEVLSLTEAPMLIIR